MKTIQCDLCKRILGQTVDVGNFISFGSGARYSPSSFVINVDEHRAEDICSECFIKIAEAQNKAIEEIKSSFNIK